MARTAPPFVTPTTISMGPPYPLEVTVMQCPTVSLPFSASSTPSTEPAPGTGSMGLKLSASGITAMRARAFSFSWAARIASAVAH